MAAKLGTLAIQIAVAVSALAVMQLLYSQIIFSIAEAIGLAADQIQRLTVSPAMVQTQTEPARNVSIIIITLPVQDPAHYAPVSRTASVVMQKNASHAPTPAT